MKTSDRGIALIKAHEGLRLEAYPDPAHGWSVPTIGYGHTTAAGPPKVERRAIVGDRRSYAMHLTPEGRRLAEAGMTTQHDYVAQTLGKLPAEDLAELDRLVLAWRERARAVDAP